MLWWFTLARLVAASFGSATVTLEHWEHMEVPNTPGASARDGGAARALRRGVAPSSVAPAPPL